ncbi:hypothetical protein ACAY84_005051 [Escherichia coli]|nr:hypothetical protein [Escherichia coli]
MDSVHHIWCPLFSQEFQDLPDGAETTLTADERHPELNQGILMSSIIATTGPFLTDFL